MGVNLEGSAKTGQWLIAPFILSELSNPTIDTLKQDIKSSNEVFIRFVRDAWRCASRPSIIESFLSNNIEPSLDTITPYNWNIILENALKCLDEKNNI